MELMNASQETPTKKNKVMDYLHRQSVLSWSDIHEVLDVLRSSQPQRVSGSPALRRAAFITFDYKVDGVTVEIEKYADALRHVVPGLELSYIGAAYDPRIARRLAPASARTLIPELRGFESWPLYERMFYRPLQPGSPAIDRLARDLWAETLAIAAQLTRAVQRHRSQLLVPVNILSNPGNVSAALAIVLVSELLRVPLIINNHDYYWEGGSSQARRKKGAAPGPRDHFFSQEQIPDVHQLITRLYPWHGPQHQYLNINALQSRHLVRQGFSLRQVREIETVVDHSAPLQLDPQRRLRILSSMFGTRDGLVRSIDATTSVSARVPAVPVLYGLGAPRLISVTPDDMVLLQPTRILERKRIEIDLQLIAKLFGNRRFQKTLIEHPEKNVVLLISGPIADGHHQYFFELVREFGRIGKSIPSKFRDRVYVGFLLGTLPAPDQKRPSRPHIYDLYQSSNMILLPSVTEGRGLPIIESAMLGVPLFAHRYQPQVVYRQVLGTHLPASRRLRVIDFSGDRLPQSTVEAVAKRLTDPRAYTSEIRHNYRAARSRYSTTTLQQDWRGALRRLGAFTLDR
jgi:glycosyltransferase involved in cell wall biosynthesis